MSEELIPTNRQEKIMSDTIRALNGDAVTDALVPGWDDEYFLDNILKAAQGEDPQYNLEPRWHHQKFYKAIAEAIAESGGGGAKLLATKEFTVNTTSTAEAAVGTVDLPDNNFGESDIIVVHIRDKAGIRDGYFFGSDAFFINAKIANGSSLEETTKPQGAMYISSNKYTLVTGTYGVYAYSLSHKSDEHSVDIRSKYSANNSKTVDGTYVVEVYKWTPPFTLFGVR